ncbi:MAG: LemA family protein, partial [Acidovorax sp.]|uniref:LemA family protein n=1 Tax=Acidovorax sp. TaxID=1872122 RepID=UPI0039E3BF5C
SLAAARARPLQADAVAALAAARDVLHASWRKAMDKSGAEAMEVAVPALPWQARWDDQLQQNDQASRVFNEAVAQYNAAIAQFPASLLARVFGFKAARGL